MLGALPCTQWVCEKIKFSPAFFKRRQGWRDRVPASPSADGEIPLRKEAQERCKTFQRNVLQGRTLAGGSPNGGTPVFDSYLLFGLYRSR